MSVVHERGFVAAVALAVLGLVVPAAPALADDPPNPVTFVSVTPIDAVVFPAVDGYHDTTQFVATVGSDEGQRRVRGSVSLTLNGRILQTWPLVQTGNTLIDWDGRVAGKIVPGTYTVLVRAVDDDGTAFSDSSSLRVSAAKLTRVSTTRTQDAWGNWECTDDHVSATWQLRHKRMYQICRLTYHYQSVLPKLMTLRGRISEGPVRYDGYLWSLTPSGVNAGLGPVTMTVTAKFTQSGSGSNQFYICEKDGCPVPTDSTLRVFSKSGTYSTTGTLETSTPRYPAWRLIVAHGHDIVAVKYTVKLTYWVLK